MTRRLLAVIVATSLLCGVAAQAFADRDDHRGRHGRHGRGGHERHWNERRYVQPRGNPYYYYQPRPEVYYYAPPPVYVPPRPRSFGLNLVFPFHFD